MALVSARLCFSIPQLSISTSSPPGSRHSLSPNLAVKSEPMSPRHPGEPVVHMVRSHGNHLSPAPLNTGKTSSTSCSTNKSCSGDSLSVSSPGNPCVSPVPPEIHIQHSMDSYEGLPLHKRLRMSENWNS